MMSNYSIFMVYLLCHHKCNSDMLSCSSCAVVVIAVKLCCIYGVITRSYGVSAA